MEWNEITVVGSFGPGVRHYLSADRAQYLRTQDICRWRYVKVGPHDDYMASGLSIADPGFNIEGFHYAYVGEESTMDMAQWLRTLPNIKDVQPVKVQLGGLEFEGARFKSIHQYTADMRIVTEGRAQAGDTYESDRFEFIGHRPEKFKNRRNFCFEFEGGEWYISHYYDKDDKNDYHPFGACFGIHCWNVPDGTKIDTYERHPYVRVPMEVLRT